MGHSSRLGEYTLNEEYGKIMQNSGTFQIPVDSLQDASGDNIGAD
jgi:hypothetical protein